MKTKENGENTQDAERLAGELQKYPCLYEKGKEIKDTKRETGRKMLGEQLSSF